MNAEFIICLNIFYSDHYLIASSDKGLYWNSDNNGETKNAEFRRRSKGDDFWIKYQGDGMYGIGYNDCPLYWRGDVGNTKNAEFRCGKPIADTFWIKGGYLHIPFGKTIFQAPLIFPV